MPNLSITNVDLSPNPRSCSTAAVEASEAMNDAHDAFAEAIAKFVAIAACNRNGFIKLDKTGEFHSSNGRKAYAAAVEAASIVVDERPIEDSVDQAYVAALDAVQGSLNRALHEDRFRQRFPVNG